jgi:hypothetical protein
MGREVCLKKGKNPYTNNERSVFIPETGENDNDDGENHSSHIV